MLSLPGGSNVAITEAEQKEHAYNFLERDSTEADYFGHSDCMDVHSMHYLPPSYLIYFS